MPPICNRLTVGTAEFRRALQRIERRCALSHWLQSLPELHMSNPELRIEYDSLPGELLGGGIVAGGESHLCGQSRWPDIEGIDRRGAPRRGQSFVAPPEVRQHDAEQSMRDAIGRV